MGLTSTPLLCVIVFDLTFYQRILVIFDPRGTPQLSKMIIPEKNPLISIILPVS